MNIQTYHAFCRPVYCGCIRHQPQSSRCDIAYNQLRDVHPAEQCIATPESRAHFLHKQDTSGSMTACTGIALHM